MRKILALTLVLMLLFPAIATAAEVTDEEGTPGYTISLFGYAIVVVPATEEDPAAIGIFKADENGDPTEEEITSFTLGGILGSSVSTLAKAVAPGPDHGKVVSTFVRTVNEERKEAKKAEIEERKEEKQTLREQKREEKQERKEEHQTEIEQKKEQKQEQITNQLQYPKPQGKGKSNR